VRKLVRYPAQVYEIADISATHGPFSWQPTFAVLRYNPQNFEPSCFHNASRHSTFEGSVAFQSFCQLTIFNSKPFVAPGYANCNDSAYPRGCWRSIAVLRHIECKCASRHIVYLSDEGPHLCRFSRNLEDTFSLVISPKGYRFCFSISFES
jgi:hypothetical protein